MTKVFFIKTLKLVFYKNYYRFYNNNLYFLFFKNYESETFLIRQVIFNVISILTGTGYVTTNYSEWGIFR